ITVAGAVKPLAIGATMTSGGSGYNSAPTVTFAGGGATTPATGVANIDPDTHMVTGITILTPGDGYSSTPAIVFNNTGTGGTGAAATPDLGVLVTRAAGSELGSFLDDGF